MTTFIPHSLKIAAIMLIFVSGIFFFTYHAHALCPPPPITIVFSYANTYDGGFIIDAEYGPETGGGCYGDWQPAVRDLTEKDLTPILEKFKNEELNGTNIVKTRWRCLQNFSEDCDLVTTFRKYSDIPDTKLLKEQWINFLEDWNYILDKDFLKKIDKMIKQQGGLGTVTTPTSTEEFQKWNLTIIALAAIGFFYFLYTKLKTKK